jgi:UDP-N-acetyl-D-glucosamine dehydrogenase
MSRPETRTMTASSSAYSGTADIAIVGAGYVGVPLAHVFATAGRSVVLVDVSDEVVASLNRGVSHIKDLASDDLAPLVREGRISATTDYDVVRHVDAILIALPTPLSKQREPDLSIVVGAAEEVAKRLRRGHLVVLESTTYPRTTREVLLPILESRGLEVGDDFHLAYSPERVDPGNDRWTTRNVPKIVGGITPACTERAAELYGAAVETVHRVSTPEVAELTKLLENVFRSVNIALVNELAQLCERMDIDVWEVVDAAATKPFGFMSFQPGPGLGGHCIPIDPFYLTWKAREYGFYTEFVELAGKVNENMPYYCRSLISQALNHGLRRSLSASRILVLGVAYKADIGDTRESPALKLIELLRGAGAEVAYHDPFVPELPEAELSSVELDPADYDCVVVVTAHSSIDYDDLVDRAQVVVDLRNATGEKGRASDKVWKL